MDPNDLPTRTTVKKCLKMWGTEEFPDAFLTELRGDQNALPLERLCLHGGWPSGDGWAELNDLEIDDESEGIATGTFSVSFTEEAPSGCRDMPHKHHQEGVIPFKLNLKTGDVEFEPPRDVREYERDEF